MTLRIAHGKSTPCVLLVEDDADMRMFLRTILENEGYAVTETDNGADGLSVASSDRPDVVLLDRRMPHLEGLRVLKTLQANPRTTGVPVIIVTSLDAEHEQSAGFEAGAAAYLTKPVQPTELLSAIEGVLEPSQSSEAETRLAQDPEDASTPAPPQLDVGSVVADKYVIEDVLGQGGMATVFCARHKLLGRRVALKVIRHDRDSGGARRRFLREAQVIHSLVHPHIVLVRDFGVTEDGALYLGMDLCRGRSLRQLIQREGPLPASRAVALIAQMLDALAFAHEQRIVHQDIKPENIMVDADRDHVRLLDFGLARVVPPARRSTASGRIWVGTPLYMSPEQARGARIDHRADLFSAGMILYELLSNRLPYECAGDVEEVRQERLRAEPRALSEVADVSPELAAAVMKALQPIHLRWPDATEFRRALLALDLPSGAE